MKNNRFIFLLIFCLCVGCGQRKSKIETQEDTQTSGQEKERLSLLTTFTKEEYLEDFNQLIKILKENHPQLHEYIAKDKFEALIKGKSERLKDNFKIGEFTWLCRSIISEIGCGHSVVPTLGMNYYLPDSLLFPLKVRYLNNKLYVLDPLENKDQVAIGDEIISINGKRVNEIKEELYQHISSDAGNRSFKTELINDGFMEYAAFHFKFVNKFEIELTKNKETKVVRLNQLNSYTEAKQNHKKCNENLCLELDKNNDLAIVTIRSFYYYRENFTEFKAFIDDCFTKIKSNQIQHLIIDLRDNGGGDPYCASYLLQHIADKPFQYYKKGISAYEDLQQEILPHKNKFSGKPILLINGRCFSSTGQFCALVKANDFGIFVGKETGATYRCNSTARPFELTNTGVTPYIATRTYEAAVSTLPKDKGILPDYQPKSSISDLLKHKDVDMEFSIRLLIKDSKN